MALLQPPSRPALAASDTAGIARRTADDLDRSREHTHTDADGSLSELLDDASWQLRAYADLLDLNEALKDSPTWAVRRHGEPDVQLQADTVRLGEHHVQLLDAAERVVFAGPTATTDLRRISAEVPRATFHPASGAPAGGSGVSSPSKG